MKKFLSVFRVIVECLSALIPVLTYNDKKNENNSTSRFVDK